MLQLRASIPLFFVLAGCAGPPARSTVDFVATIQPLRAILLELTGDAERVAALLQPGASPHTYEPRPSDARMTEQALGLFYIAPDIDGWAARMPAQALVPTAQWIPEELALYWDAHLSEGITHDEHGHGEVNTHYWGDPLLVKAMLPQFVAALSAGAPADAAQFESNAAQFGEALDELHEELDTMLAPLRGKRVVLFHPSWNYFLRRYGIEVAGIVEPYGGKEMSPRYLKSLIDRLQAQGVDAVFTEPQLNHRPAEVVAESGPWPLAELDPLGGAGEIQRYDELLRHNARVLLETLQ